MKSLIIAESASRCFDPKAGDTGDAADLQPIVTRGEAVLV